VQWKEYRDNKHQWNPNQWLYLGTEPRPDRGNEEWGVFRPTTGGEETEYRTGYQDVNLIARDRAQFTELEQLATNLPETDDVTRFTSAIRIGEKVTLYAIPAKTPLTDDSDLLPQPGGENGLVTGTLIKDLYRKVSNVPILKGWIIENNGIEQAYLKPEHQDFIAIRHDFVTAIDPEIQAKQSRLQQSVPGDKIIGATQFDQPRLGQPKTELPHELIKLDTRWQLDTNYLDPETGKEITLKAFSFGCDTVISGAELTSAQSETLFEDWPNLEVSQLRGGDRAIVGDINPNAKSNRNPATITEVRLWGQPQLTYLQDNVGEPVTIGASSTRTVPLLSRRHGALTTIEQRMLTGGTYLAETAAKDVEIGTRVWAYPNEYPNRDEPQVSGIGTITNRSIEKTQAKGRYGSGMVEHPVLTISMDDGKQVTVNYAQGGQHNLITYPPDVEIPTSIDPHSGTVAYPNPAPIAAPAPAPTAPSFNQTPSTWANQNTHHPAHEFDLN